jgi:streptomycin 3"-adenylyltransferase
VLVERLTPISDRRVRPGEYRPIELTIVALADVKPWRYPARADFQWGEWLRANFDAGHVPEPHVNPDLAVLYAQVRARSQAFIGPPATALLDAIPAADLERAMLGSLPSLMAELPTDTTNVLLTLARIRHTLATGTFASKDTAADWALERMPGAHAPAMDRARDAYLDRGEDDWTDHGAAAAAAAEWLRDAPSTPRRRSRP